MAALEDLLHQALSGAQGASVESPIAGMTRSLFQGVPGGMNSHGVGDLAGLTAQFENAGYGDIVRSWYGDTPLPVTETQLREVLGPRVAGIAAGSGLTEDDLLRQLAQLLPGMVRRIHGDRPIR